MTETQIRDLMNDYTAAMRKGDADWIVEHRTADIALYSLAPPLRQTVQDALSADGLRAWFGTFAGPVDFEIRDLDITESGELAYAHALTRLTATPLGSDESFTLWFRTTWGYRRENDGWVIALEHESVPFYMDENMNAALDLQP
jgi:ketosteroid isomerase-like protein